MLTFLLSLSWIYSLIIQPSQWNRDTIFYPIDGEEKRLFDEKKGLDTSSIKVLYYNKTTIYTNRYLNNFFNLLDINSYFFKGHPREDVSGKTFRLKLVWFLVIPFFFGIWKLKISRWWLVPMLGLSFLKNPDGWDLILIFPISLIIKNGFNNLHTLWKNS